MVSGENDERGNDGGDEERGGVKDHKRDDSLQWGRYRVG